MRRPAAREWLLAAALAWPAAAQCETYAVVPLVGRQLTVVTAERTTATNVDRNHYGYVPIADAVFDDTVNATVAKIVRARRADDATMLVRLGLEASPEELASPELVTKVIAAVAPKAVAAGAARLVIVAPYRAAPMLILDNGHVGTGNVAGIGLYVNHFLRTRNSEGAEGEYGFLGLFANVRVLVVDAGSSAVLAEDVARSGTALSAVRAADGNPLNVLTSAERVRYLQTLLAKSVTDILPALLQRAEPGKP
jgi:hypothetical protein